MTLNHMPNRVIDFFLNIRCPIYSSAEVLLIFKVLLVMKTT